MGEVASRLAELAPGEDVWGLFLAVAGLLAALGVYAGLLGPAGRLLREGSGDLFGAGRFLVPIGLVTVGIMGIRGEPHPGNGRALAGLGVAVVAVSSLAGLAGGSPRLGAALPGLRAAGGWAGALVGRPLGQFLSPWGAAIVLVTALLVSLLFLGGRSVRELAEGCAVATGALGRAASRAAESVKARRRVPAVARRDRRGRSPGFRARSGTRVHFAL